MIPKIQKPVSLIVPVLNNLQYTQLFLKSFYKCSHSPYELIFIDNASTDGTSEYLKDVSTTDPYIKIITNEKNLGVVKSWNLGIRHSNFDYLCFLNNDIEFQTSDWIVEMQSIIEKDNCVYWVSPKTCYKKNPNKMSYKISHYEQLLYDLSGLNYVVGCCFMIPRRCFDEIGVFDEGFDIRYYEDLDFINRILKAKKKICCCHNALVYHAVGKTSTITPGGETNESYYYSKWGNSPFDILSKQKPRIKAIKHFK